MASTWADPIDKDYCWQDVAVQNLFANVVKERQDYLGGALIRPPAAGYIDPDTTLALPGGNPHSMNQIANWQEWITQQLTYDEYWNFGNWAMNKEVVGGVWQNRSDDLTGLDDVPYWDIDTALAAAGCGSGFRRKYPYEVDNPASTTLLDGVNTVIVSDTLYYRIKHNALGGHDGRVFKKTVGGWVLADNPWSQPPSMIETAGIVQDGDYMGPWIWEDLRNLLNLMLWNRLNGLTVAWHDGTRGQCLYQQDPSYATVLGKVAAGWTTDPTYDGAPFAYYWTYNDGAQYAAWGDDNQAAFHISDGINETPAVRSVVDYYVMARDLSSTYGADASFNGQGVVSVKDKINRVCSVLHLPSVLITDLCSTNVGTASAPPANAPAAPASGKTIAYGFRTDWTTWVRRWLSDYHD